MTVASTARIARILIVTGLPHGKIIDYIVVMRQPVIRGNLSFSTRERARG